MNAARAYSLGILAGGQGARWGGRDKGLIALVESLDAGALHELTTLSLASNGLGDASAAALARQCPATRFVLDHCGGHHQMPPRAPARRLSLIVRRPIWRTGPRARLHRGRVARPLHRGPVPRPLHRGRGSSALSHMQVR